MTDSGRAIWVTAQLAGTSALDVLLLKKDVGDGSLQLYFNYPQAGPLAGAPIGQAMLQSATGLTQAFPVDKGQYYLVFDNTATAGGTNPVLNPLADAYGTVSYAVQLGDAP